MYFVLRRDGGSVGAFSAQIDDILRRGAPGVPENTRTSSEARAGELKSQETSFAHVGIEPSQAGDYSVRLTQADFSPKLAPLEKSPALWAARQQLLHPEDVIRCQYALGEPCWLTAASLTDICARLCPLASKVNSLQMNNIYRINDLM